MTTLQDIINRVPATEPSNRNVHEVLLQMTKDTFLDVLGFSGEARQKLRELVAKYVRVIARNFEQGSKDLQDRYPAVAKEYKDAIAWLTYNRPQTLCYPLIFYSRPTLKKKIYEHIKDVWPEIEMTVSNPGKFRKGNESLYEFWDNVFTFYELVVILHEIAHIRYHWKDYFSKYFNQGDIIFSVKLMEIEKSTEIETQAWQGAETLLNDLTNAPSIQLFTDYPNLSSSILNEILTPLMNEDLVATEAAKQAKKPSLPEAVQSLWDKVKPWRT